MWTPILNFVMDQGVNAAYGGWTGKSARAPVDHFYETELVLHHEQTKDRQQPSLEYDWHRRFAEDVPYIPLQGLCCGYSSRP